MTSRPRVAFDKAEQAEQLEKEIRRLRTEIEQGELAVKVASAEDANQLHKTIEEMRRHLEELAHPNEPTN